MGVISISLWVLLGIWFVVTTIIVVREEWKNE